MRTLSATLEAAQKAASRTPCATLTVTPTVRGVKRLAWTRLYTGAEAAANHAMAMPADGSMVRARIIGADLRWQRIVNPEDPLAPWSVWPNAVAGVNPFPPALATLGAEVALVYIDTATGFPRIAMSSDSGASFAASTQVAPIANVKGLAAAYKPNGELIIVMQTATTITVKMRTGAGWWVPVAYPGAFNDGYGCAAIYTGDWTILLGDQLSPDFHLHVLQYGDGGTTPYWTWSALKSLYANPEAVYPNYISAEKPAVACLPGDSYLVTFAERYAGNWPYNKIVTGRSVKDTTLYDCLFTDPAPFATAAAGLDGIYGLALAVNPAATRVYAVRPDAVFFAPLATSPLDLSSLLRGAVYGTNGISSQNHAPAFEPGKLVLELTNDNHALDPANVGAGSLAVLARGNDLSLSLGCRTSAGLEVSALGSHTVDSFGWRRDKVNLSLFTIIARDGWEALKRWRARYPLRFNDTPNTTTLYAILAAVLARTGYRLRYVSRSALATGFYPQFTVNPGARGDTLVKRLLEMMPDRIYFRGHEAWLVNPLAVDAAVYSYGGTGHTYDKGVFVQGSPEFTQMRVSGKDLAGGPNYTEGVDWTTFAAVGSRLVYEHDVALRDLSPLNDRFQAALRQEVVDAEAGELVGQPNVAQELWDVVAVTDPTLGMSAVRYRVAGMTVTYNPADGACRQRLALSEV